jgi:hypothetical protein
MRDPAETETIHVAADHHDRERTRAARDHWHATPVMEAIRDWGFEAAAECCSSGLCAPERS